jgi:hypothetical protein
MVMRELFSGEDGIEPPRTRRDTEEGYHRGEAKRYPVLHPGGAGVSPA